MEILMRSFTLICFLFLFSSSVQSQGKEVSLETGQSEMDDDITLEKKSLMILTTAYDEDQEIAERILSIISDQATSVGRFEIIDRNLVDEILEEQKFQLSGMVDNDQVVRIGELASAENGLILDIINYGQEGVPKDDSDKDEEEVVVSQT